MKACPKFMIKSASSRDKFTGPRNFFCLAVCGGWLWSRRSPLGLTDHTSRMPSFRREMYTLKGQQSSFDSGADVGTVLLSSGRTPDWAALRLCCFWRPTLWQ